MVWISAIFSYIVIFWSGSSETRVCHKSIRNRTNFNSDGRKGMRLTCLFVCTSGYLCMCGVIVAPKTTYECFSCLKADIIQIVVKSLLRSVICEIFLFVTNIWYLIYLPTYLKLEFLYLLLKVLLLFKLNFAESLVSIRGSNSNWEVLYFKYNLHAHLWTSILLTKFKSCSRTTKKLGFFFPKLVIDIRVSCFNPLSKGIILLVFIIFIIDAPLLCLIMI